MGNKEKRGGEERSRSARVKTERKRYSLDHDFNRYQTSRRQWGKGVGKVN